MLNIKWLPKYQFCVINEMQLKILLAMIPSHAVTVDYFRGAYFPLYIAAYRHPSHNCVCVARYDQKQQDKQNIEFDQIPGVLCLEDGIPIDIAERMFSSYKRDNARQSSLDMTYMPNSVGPNDTLRVRTIKTQYGPVPNDYTLNSKILPPMSYFNTAAVLNATAQASLKKPTQSEVEVLEFKVRFGSSKKSIEMQMIREIPDNIDVDEVNFLIEEIF